MSKRLLTAALAALVSGSILAAGPQEHAVGNVRYLSGGIGQDEVQAMKEAAARYNLGMTFTAGGGEYLSDVKVVVKNRGGAELLSVVSDGPMLLASLPPGPYTVEATAEGRTQARTITLPRNGRRQLILRW